jgi:hypothetical protein
LKLTGIQHLVDAGPFTKTDAWSRVEADLREATAGVVWPPGNDRFVINPVIDGNGVVPIKRQFAANHSALGWKLFGDLEVGLGYLGISIVEHDESDLKVPLIERQQTRFRRLAEESLPY